MLKNSEEQFIHSNVSQRIVTLHNKKHYESKKKNFMNLWNKQPVQFMSALRFKEV